MLWGQYGFLFKILNLANKKIKNELRGQLEDSFI